MDRPLHDRLKPRYEPMSTKRPSQKEIGYTNTLLAQLDILSPLENKEEKARRTMLLQTLSAMLNEWVESVAAAKGMPHFKEEGMNSGKLFVSGSYRLAVNSRGADIDTICCVPRHVSRDDFFDEENGLVARLKAHPDVSHVLAIAGAKVPIIEVIWNDIELDVLYSQVQLNRVPQKPDELLDDSVLQGMDEASVMSLNGPRVTEMLVKMVEHNLETFRIVLRAVRVWAKKRGIYSNKMGFLGGVNYAILVVFVCQMFPEATASKVLFQFFAIFKKWEWPDPVELCFKYEVPLLGRTQWDPRVDYRARQDLMPIITPAYPCLNSSYNVSSATLDVMKREFERGLIIATKAITGKAQWDELFEPSDFFVLFSDYLVVTAGAKTAQNLTKWSGYLESQLRNFTVKLQNQPLNIIYLFPRRFSVATAVENTREGGGEKKDGEEANVEAPPASIRWYIGIKRRYDKVTTSKLALSNEVNFWKERTLGWQDRDEGCSVTVGVTKWKDLPDVVDLFPDGKNAALPARLARARRDAMEKRAQQAEAHDALGRSRHQVWEKGQKTTAAVATPAVKADAKVEVSKTVASAADVNADATQDMRIKELGAAGAEAVMASMAKEMNSVKRKHLDVDEEEGEDTFEAEKEELKPLFMLVPLPGLDPGVLAARAAGGAQNRPARRLRFNLLQ